MSWTGRKKKVLLANELSGKECTVAWPCLSSTSLFSWINSTSNCGTNRSVVCLVTPGLAGIHIFLHCLTCIKKQFNNSIQKLLKEKRKREADNVLIHHIWQTLYSSMPFQFCFFRNIIYHIYIIYHMVIIYQVNQINMLFLGDFFLLPSLNLECKENLEALSFRQCQKAIQCCAHYP